MKKTSQAVQAASGLTLALAAGEGQYVEFKEQVSDGLSREMVAFANAGGGSIYVGVADNRQIKGLKITNRLLSQVHDIARKCEPPINVTLVPFDYRGNHLLRILVDEGDEKPYGCSAGYFLRTGPSSQKMNRTELVRFLRGVGEVRFDEMPCEWFRYPADFSAAAFRSFRRRHQRLHPFTRARDYGSGLSHQTRLGHSRNGRLPPTVARYRALEKSRDRRINCRLCAQKTQLTPESQLFYEVWLKDQQQTPDELQVIDRLLDLDQGLLEFVAPAFSAIGAPARRVLQLLRALLLLLIKNVRSENFLVNQELKNNLLYRWFVRLEKGETIDDSFRIAMVRLRARLARQLKPGEWQEFLAQTVVLAQAQDHLLVAIDYPLPAFTQTNRRLL